MAAFGRATWLLIVVLETVIISVAANGVCSSWVSNKSCIFEDPRLVFDLGPATDDEHCMQLCSNNPLLQLGPGCCTGNPSLSIQYHIDLSPLQKPCTFIPSLVGQMELEDNADYKAAECGLTTSAHPLPATTITPTSKTSTTLTSTTLTSTTYTSSSMSNTSATTTTTTTLTQTTSTSTSGKYTYTTTKTTTSTTTNTTLTTATNTTWTASATSRTSVSTTAPTTSISTATSSTNTSSTLSTVSSTASTIKTTTTISTVSNTSTTTTSTSSTNTTTTTQTITASTVTTSTLSTVSSTASTITTTTTISTVSNTSTTSTSTSSTNTTTQTTTTSTVTTSTVTTSTVTTSTVTTSTVPSTAAPTGDQVLVVLQQAETSTAAALSASNKTSITTVQAGATISVHKINVSEVVSSSRSVNVSVPGSNVSVSLPASILQAVGVKDAVLSVTSYGNASTAVASSAKALPAGSTLASEPVSIRILVSNGSQDFNFTQKFSQPVAIRLMSSRPAGANCAFWDELERRWSNRDVTTRVVSDGSMICDTLHLTLFAAIISEFGNVLKCSNANVMTGEGLKAIGRGDWWMSASAIFLWGVMLAQVIVLGTTLAHDRRNTKRRVWRDEDFLTVNAAYQTKSVACAKLQEMFKCCNCCKKKGKDDEPDASESSEVQKDHKSGVVKAMEKATVSAMQGTAVKAVAWHEQLHPEDLSNLIKGVIEAQKKDDEESFEQDHRVHSTPSDFAPLALSVSDRASMAFDHFRYSPFFLNTAVFFAALHPWLNLGQFSISTSAFIRALLLTARLLGALMISAMFFDGTGMAKSKGSECTAQGFWAVLWRNVAVSIVSALLSTIPLLFIRFLRSRRFVYKTSWDDKKEMQKYLRRWRVEDVLVVALGITYCLLCDLFIMAFLANISQASEWDWLTSAIIVVIKEMVVTPVIMAMMFAAFVTLVARKRPDLITQVGQHAGFISEDHSLRRTQGHKLQAWGSFSVQAPIIKLPTIMDLNLAKEALAEKDLPDMRIVDEMTDEEVDDKAPEPLAIDDDAMHNKAILNTPRTFPYSSHMETSWSGKHRILVGIVFAAWAARIGEPYVVQMYPVLPGGISPEFH